jgi:membrane associated rhomboid family serine protease
MQDVQTCYRHAGRNAGVRCQRCERPICPDCMRQASVGFHCPECAGAGTSRAVSAGRLFRVHETPIVTNALLAVLVAVFAWTLTQGADLVGFESSPVHEDYGVNALAANGEWWRILTSGFLHYGAFHLLMNGYALYVLGPQLERALGHLEFLGVYLVSLLAGSFGALLVEPFATTAGASGAIYGLLATALVLQRRLGIDPWASGLGGIILINMVLTFSISQLSLGGHIGGFVGGLAAGFVVVESRAQRQPLIALAGCTALAAAFALGAWWAADQALTTGTPLIPFER